MNRRFPFYRRRCPCCYLPMRYSFQCAWWRCDLCDTAICDEWLYLRSRWRRLWDRLTGLDEG